LKFPSKSVIAPIAVPSIDTETPIKASPFVLSKMEPLIKPSCAMSREFSMKNRITKENFTNRIIKKIIDMLLKKIELAGIKPAS
jgi:hypothetical protein